MFDADAAKDEAALARVSVDMARLLVDAVRAAPVVPTYMSQVAAAMLASDGERFQGRYNDALQRLKEAHALQPEGGECLDAFWLALCHARLGHTEEARRWLKEGSQWLGTALQRKSTENPLPWDQRLICQHLQREAEALLRPR